MGDWTPGPWKYVNSIIVQDMGDEAPRAICKPYPGTDCDANARLIAAAPALYEALEIARNGLAVFNAITPNYHTEGALKEIEAALALAREES